jgi:AcrR family transcriptional regulator
VPKAPTSKRRAAGATSVKRDPGRRQAILDVAAALFAEKGVATTTVRDIGDASGILSGSLYYHFASKEAIVEEVVREYTNDLISRYRETIEAFAEPRARFEGLVRSSFAAMAQHKHACEIYQNDFRYLSSLPQLKNLTAFNDEVQAIWMETINAGVKSKVFRADIDAQIFYRFMRDSIWFAVRWYSPKGRDSEDRIADACIGVLLDGFARHD